MTKTERTRQFIIETTAPIFNSKGYEGTSMSDITSATGLTKGSVYGNFKDKNELAAAAFDHNVQKIRTGIINRSIGLKDPTEQLVVYVDFYAEIFDKVVITGGCPILNTAVDSDDSNPLLYNRVRSALIEWHSHVESVVVYGIKKSFFHSETNPSEFADNLLALIEGGVLLSKTLNNKKHLMSNLKLIRKLIQEITI